MFYQYGPTENILNKKFTCIFYFSSFPLYLPCLLWWHFFCVFHLHNNFVFISTVFGDPQNSKHIILLSITLSDTSTAHILFWWQKIGLDLHILNMFCIHSETLPYFYPYIVFISTVPEILTPKPIFLMLHKIHILHKCNKKFLQ